MPIETAQKKLFIEHLRFIATIAVILLHTVTIVSLQFKAINLDSWFLATFVNASLRFCVPIFIMISGALNLDPDKDFQLVKRLKTVLLPFLFWSVIYIAYVYNNEKDLGINLSQLIQKPAYYHLWFPYMLIGLYLLTPLIRSFISKTSIIKTALVFWLVWSVAFPIISHYTSLVPYIDLNFMQGYLGLYLFGYYLSKTSFNIPKWALGILYMAISVITFYLVWQESHTHQTFDQYFFGNLTPNVLVMSVAIFLFIKNITDEDAKINKLISTLNSASYQIYLVHALVLDILVFKILRLQHLNILEIIGIFVAVLVISFTIGVTFSKINFKYIYIVFFSLSIVIGLISTLPSIKLPQIRFILPNIKTNTIIIPNKRGGYNYEVTSSKLIIKSNETSTLRIALPVHMLASIKPINSCKFYVPNDKKSDANISGYSFESIDWENNNFGISKTDVYGQLICEKINEINLTFTDFGSIAIVKM